MAVYEVDPISRIEGHLGVKVDASANVNDAEMHGNLWRGFENFLLGRAVNDAITFTQRICGVCPVPHGQTSTYAVDAALGYSRSHITFAYDGAYGVPKKAVHIRNLVLSAEFLMSHLTHFYHLVALDYVQGPKTPPWTPYFDTSFYDGLLKNPTDAGYTGTSDASGNGGILPTNDGTFSQGLWDAVITQYVKALRIRRLTFEAGALFAGRMPMTSCFVGGGVTNDGTEDLDASGSRLYNRIGNFRQIMEEVGDFIIREHVPLVLALSYLYQPYDNSGNGSGANYGAGWGNFVAWGAFPDGDDSGASAALALPGGVKVTNVATGGSAADFQVLTKADVYNKFLGDDGSGNDIPGNLVEDIASSHYAVSALDTTNYTGTRAYPGAVQRTKPARLNGYSYIKSPRWAGNPCEVGPYARLVVAGFYPIDQSALATSNLTSAGLGVTGYDAYVKTIGATPGLRPSMIHQDLAVALVKEGVATVEIDDGSGNPVSAGTAAQQIAAYVGNATAIVSGPITNWIYGLKGGLSAMDRIRARALEALYLVQQMIGSADFGESAPGADDDTGGSPVTFPNSGWIDSAALLDNSAGSSWRQKNPPTTAQTGKWGATEAPRGALAHFVSTNAQGKITAYQCVVPTTWNANPKDSSGNHGPIEKAIIGVPWSGNTSTFTSADTSGTVSGQNGLEALRVAHTFDPCIACAVH